MLKGFQQRGILLAAASRNNPDDALEVLENHPGMILRPSDFTVLEIGWEDKPTMLRRVAERLNLGLEALVFLDDDPGNIAQVRQWLPQVLSLQMAEEPAEMVRRLAYLPHLQQLSLTREDEQRSRMYAENLRRRDLEKRTASRGEFLTSLEMEVRILVNQKGIIPRLAQMCRKTNQFNTTTLRLSEGEIAQRIAAPQTDVVALDVRDRFGSHGITGLAIMTSRGETGVIELLLLSCRVLGKDLEFLLLARLTRLAREKGLQKLQGRVNFTPRNPPVRRVFADFGFALKEAGEQSTLWELELEGRDYPDPPWFRTAEEIHNGNTPKG